MALTILLFLLYIISLSLELEQSVKQTSGLKLRSPQSLICCTLINCEYLLFIIKCQSRSFFDIVLFYGYNDMLWEADLIPCPVFGTNIGTRYQLLYLTLNMFKMWLDNTPTFLPLLHQATYLTRLMIIVACVVPSWVILVITFLLWKHTNHFLALWKLSSRNEVSRLAPSWFLCVLWLKFVISSKNTVLPTSSREQPRTWQCLVIFCRQRENDLSGILLDNNYSKYNSFLEQTFYSLFCGD